MRQRQSEPAGVVLSMTKAGIRFWWADKSRWFKAYTALLVLMLAGGVVFGIFHPHIIPIAIMFGMFVIFYLIADYYGWCYKHSLPLAMETVRIHQCLDRGGYVKVERLDKNNIIISHHKEGGNP